MRATNLLIIAALLVSASRRAEAQLPIAVDNTRPQQGRAPIVSVTLKLNEALEGDIEVIRFISGPSGAWLLADTSAFHLGSDDHEVRVPGTAGDDVLLLMRSADRPGYLLEGPFRWPDAPATFSVSQQWRRTIRGRWSRSGSPPPVWLGAAEEAVPDRWPQCRWHTHDQWECVGIPFAASGVVVTMPDARVTFGIARGGSGTSMERVDAGMGLWGRLVIIAANASPSASVPHVSALRAQPPRTRPRSIRVDAVRERRVKVEVVSPRAFWLSGSELPDGTWLEVTEPGSASARIPLIEVAEAPAELPLRISLGTGHSLHGRISRADGKAVSGVALGLYRLFDDQKDVPEKRQTRLLVSNLVTGSDGAFRFDDLGAERFELIGLHGTLGRSEWRIEPGPEPHELVMQPRSQVVGRVVRAGAPVPAIRVTVMPAMEQLAISEDVTRLAAGEVRSGADGGFTLALPVQGRAELRIGSEAAGVARVQLGPAESAPARIDVGPIELPVLPTLSIVLEASEGCDLMLTGPAGSAGMTLVRAVRVGPSMYEATLPEHGRWFAGARCAGRGRAVSPGLIDVSVGTVPQPVRLAWPQ